MSEGGAGPRPVPECGQGPKRPVPRQRAQGHQDPDLVEQLQFPDQIGKAVVALLWGRAVRRLTLSCPRLQAPAGNFDFSTA